jgi:hypothetical protein
MADAPFLVIGIQIVGIFDPSYALCSLMIYLTA